MSDTFDHEGDAWASLDWTGEGNDPYGGGYGMPRRSGNAQYRRPLCRECKTTCDWHHTGERWVLFSNGKPHKCDISNQFEDCGS